ncbi:WD repeat-containing protein 59-like [Tropilaelaps mercedesae]|uniref:WD repeat-containing protein 59-like n=1 Tax=Tropilaelaps mercedesae TaxID=418985 RepID=A0A1V9XJL6_9ACAR|nr:WD repeat-containing protein 59-like [Tropilaelaps mercedesae]
MLRKLLTYGERQSPMQRVSSSPLFSNATSRKGSTIEDKWMRSPALLQASYAPLTMAMDPNSFTVFLADHSTMSLLDLDQGRMITKGAYAPNTARMNPACVNAEWNPTERSLVLLTSASSLYLVRSSNDSLAVEHIKRAAHKRAITDVNWCRGTNLFVTAGQEEYLYVWDARTMQRPEVALSSLVPSSRARFNGLNANVIASTHDNGIYLWDVRQPRSPMKLVGGHSSRVYSIDWSPAVEHCLVSSSQDSTVKLWDCNSPAGSGATIDKHMLLDNPAWMVKFSPLGDSLLTCYERSSSPNEDLQGLAVWNMRSGKHVHTWNTASPFINVATSNLNKVKECRIVALMKNGVLQTSVLYPMMGNSSSDHLDNISLHDDGRDNNQSLEEEFNSLINDKPPNTELVKLDAVKRMCLILVTVCLYEIEITLNFPNDYPKNVPPTFSFSKGSALQSSIKTKLQKVLRITSTQHVSRNQPCLEPCLKQLIKTLESIKALETTNKGDAETDAPKLPPVPVNIYGGEQDSSVPFPRTSGARFCGAHFLVCFTRPSYIQKNQRESDNEVTPRSLSALGAYIKAHRNPLNPRTGSSSLYPSFVAKNERDVTISSYYYREPRKKGRSRRRIRGLAPPALDKIHVPSAAVLIYSMPGVLPVCYQLASKYKLNVADPLDACRHNLEVAKECRRSDLVQVWTLAAQIIESQMQQQRGAVAGSELPWPMHVFGRQLVEHLIDRYLRLYDIQTVAMLCCVFGEVARRQTSRRGFLGDVPVAEETTHTERKASDKSGNVLKKTWQKMINAGGSPYNSITGGSSPQSHAGIPAAFLAGRLGSKNHSAKDLGALEASAVLGDEVVAVAGREPLEAGLPYGQEDDTFLLNPQQMTRYDQLKQHYAELLYKWNLLEQRCLVLNHITTQQRCVRELYDVQFKKRCAVCQVDTEDVTCAKCRQLVFRCTICELGVRGSSFFCLICYHGGHSEHMREWFQKKRFCPTGCGCDCVSYVGNDSY